MPRNRTPKYSSINPYFRAQEHLKEELLATNKELYCVACKKSIAWFCSDTIVKHFASKNHLKNKHQLKIYHEKREKIHYLINELILDRNIINIHDMKHFNKMYNKFLMIHSLELGKTLYNVYFDNECDLDELENQLNAIENETKDILNVTIENRAVLELSKMKNNCKMFKFCYKFKYN